ncbi:uncharacterized protein PHALS_08299 [Plasmopara halstedii]|uniref:Uncharacterized protein n=1 Tax=Plasmopara halstedii TaxID=4781 RepID=A0A0P1ACZ4_PLAHL|nr:uncharacterized protein PHALS_08299 [Plasmopara halstedii]CEG38212.1 hypothetical protein PHALS_08299 [Plasmopara halstedii]|eukprot:XP_024574581.1 hypothetical protein PHALS_08299 [Plasmopara halstedii]
MPVLTEVQAVRATMCVRVKKRISVCLSNFYIPRSLKFPYITGSQGAIYDKILMHGQMQ